MDTWKPQFQFSISCPTQSPLYFGSYNVPAIGRKRENLYLIYSLSALWNTSYILAASKFVQLGWGVENSISFFFIFPTESPLYLRGFKAHAIGRRRGIFYFIFPLSILQNPHYILEGSGFVQLGGNVENSILFSCIRPTESPLYFSGFIVRAIRALVWRYIYPNNIFFFVRLFYFCNIVRYLYCIRDPLSHRLLLSF